MRLNMTEHGHGVSHLLQGEKLRALIVKAIKGGGLMLIIVILAWWALVNGLADYYADQETPEAATGALRWRNDQPAALYRSGLAASERNPAEAESLLQAAAWANPTDALTYLTLAEIWQRAGLQDKAVELVKIADALGPLRTPALARSAAFWLQMNRPDLAVARWSMLLRTRPAAATQLFPVLLQLAENPATQPLLQPLLADPPEWWDRFFAHATANALQLETVAYLYHNRNRQGALPGFTEQRAYLDGLWKEKRWLQAYLAWLGGLDEQQQRALGHVYNGNFELPATNLGFDWRLSSPRGVTVETVETYGTRGSKALHVSFKGERVRFQHVQQFLYLESGRYRLQGRGRPDGLKAERGLRWRLRCAGVNVATLLAESEPFVGSDEWRNFTVEFEVPEQDCPLQILRLELEGRAELEFTAEGDVWFDDLAIGRQGDETWTRRE